MAAQNVEWRKALEQLFSASVNQQTLEEAAELMVSVSASDRSYHTECLNAIKGGIKAAEAGDESVQALINKSGYQVSSNADALELLKDFESIYLQRFGQVVGKR
jgi:hypothetical protein